MLTSKLRELRKTKKLTQAQFADAMGVSQSTVTFWENGKREPDLSTVVKLADFYDVTTDYLLGRKPMDVVTVFAEPPPKPEGFADVVIAAGPKRGVTPDSLERQIRSAIADELKKRGL